MIRGTFTAFTVAPSRPWSLDAPPIVGPASPPLYDEATADRPRIATGPELCQLAAPYDAKAFPARGAIVEHKHDGWRAIWIKGRLLTRRGLPIWNSAHLWPALAELEAAYGAPVMFDGEYIEGKGFGDTSRLCTAGIHATGPIEGNGALHLFDAVPVSVWEGREAGLPLIDRKRELALAYDRCGAPDGLWLVDHWPVATAAAAERIAADIIAAGGEGAVIKDPRSMHYAGRGRGWMKIKGKMTLDLQVIGFAPRKDDPDMLGAIICDYQGRGVRVSAGFDDRTRAMMMHHPERIAGRVAEIECMEIMDSGQLRQAVFRGWRDDLQPWDVGIIRGREGA